MTRKDDDKWETFSDADVTRVCRLIQRTLAEHAISIPLGVVSMYRVLDQVEAELDLEIKSTFKENTH